MNTGSLDYDGHSLYCRSYICPECKSVFATYIDANGNRLNAQDRWWQPPK